MEGESFYTEDEIPKKEDEILKPEDEILKPEDEIIQIEEAEIEASKRKTKKEQKSLSPYEKKEYYVNSLAWLEDDLYATDSLQEKLGLMIESAQDMPKSIETYDETFKIWSQHMPEIRNGLEKGTKEHKEAQKIITQIKEKELIIAAEKERREEDLREGRTKPNKIEESLYIPNRIPDVYQKGIMRMKKIKGMLEKQGDKAIKDEERYNKTSVEEILADVRRQQRMEDIGESDHDDAVEDFYANWDT